VVEHIEAKLMMENLLNKIIADPQLHQRWLATLSFLELCGARQIAGYLPTRGASVDLLQHAAEEFRHAYFFQQQSSRIDPTVASPAPLLGKAYIRRYLRLLDLHIARQLRRQNWLGSLSQGCYLLTTYAVEKRAEQLYGLYDDLLRQAGLKLSLRALLREETQHLAQIVREMAQCGLSESDKATACHLEAELFSHFVRELRDSIEHAPAKETSQSWSAKSKVRKLSKVSSDSRPSSLPL
jgi:hypothetical protein